MYQIITTVALKCCQHCTTGLAYSTTSIEEQDRCTAYLLYYSAALPHRTVVVWDMRPLFSCRIHNMLQILQRRSKAVSRRRGGTNALEIVLSSQKEFVDNVKICERLGCSDHNQIHVIIKVKGERYWKIRYRNNFHKGRYKDMREYLAKIDWNKKTNLISFANKSYSLSDLSIRIACNAAS